MNIESLSERCDTIVAQCSRVVLGQPEVIEQVLLAILAKGHVLLEGVPGLGKTLLVRTLGRVLGCESRRIQFTPDLMPSDVTGGNVWDQEANAFRFIPGPVFTSLLLADEINRATAKTQSALLEAMQDRTVSTDGTTRALPRPFFVLATQNPVESQGTHPLPEAQLDRFLLEVKVGYPEGDAEAQILRNVLAGFDAADLDSAGIEQVCSAEALIAMQAAVGTVRVEEDVLAYILEIVQKTRSHRSIELGASPRAAVSLLKVARAQAALQGRDFVIPDDVKGRAIAALQHRIVLHADAEFEGVTPQEALTAILRETRVPGIEA